eukprot:5775729-Amphidinium_carterae.1
MLTAARQARHSAAQMAAAEVSVLSPEALSLPGLSAPGDSRRCLDGDAMGEVAILQTEVAALRAQLASIQRPLGINSSSCGSCGSTDVVRDRAH